MILWKKPVDSVSVGGKSYRLRPSFDRVLETIDIMQDESLPEAVKQQISAWLLIKKRLKPQECYPVLSAALKVLLSTDSKKQGQDDELSISFIQDAEYIYAAFYQAYGIDLIDCRGKLHWHKFLALLNGLPGDTRMSEIIQIRLRPIPKATKYNAEEIAQIHKLKMAYRIRLSESETQTRYQKGLQKVASALISMAKQR